MAEGFARTYGQDVLIAQSAGLAPALAVVPLTHHVMLDKNIDLGDCYPKQLENVDGDIDLIVNMSGHRVPGFEGTSREVWVVRDPIGESEEVFCQVRDEIEQRVLELVERLRSPAPTLAQGRKTAPEVDTRRRPTRQ